MKMIYRVLCGAAAICIGLGLLLGLIGTALGAHPGDLFISPTELPAFRFITRMPAVWGKDTVEVTYPGEKIRRLDFDLEAMDVTIETGNSFSILAKRVNAKRFTTKVEGDTWVIDCDNGTMTGNWGNRWEKKAPKVTITVPKGWVAREAEIDLGMGSLTVRDLAAEESTLDVGMGSATVTDFRSRDCNITVGMGSLYLTGDLRGRGNISCGMGDVTLSLDGRASDFGCTASTGMGTITFDGHETGGLAGGMTVGASTADNWFDIECGMGSVDVLFTG